MMRENDFIALENLIYRCIYTFCCDKLSCRRQNGGWLNIRAIPVTRISDDSALMMLTISEMKGDESSLEKDLEDKKRDLLHNTARLISFELDMISRTLIPSEQFNMLYDTRSLQQCPADKINVLCGCIDENDIAAYRAMYSDIDSGKPEGSLRIRLRSRLTDSFSYVTLFWKSVFDYRGMAARAVGVLQPAGKVKKASNASVISSLQYRLDLQDSYLRHINEYFLQLRTYRHDSSNNIIALQAFLELGDVEAASDYLKQMGKALKSDISMINTGNPSIDAVITEKLTSAKKLGIEITHTIGISPEIKVDLMDMTIALGSCLDNAVEACGKVIDAGKSAYIDLMLIEQRGALVFKLKNSSLPLIVPEGGLPETTKEDKKNHGFGLRNVQRIVKKYGGELMLTPGQNDFTTSFTLFIS